MLEDEPQLPCEIDHRQGRGDAEFFWHARVSQTHGQAGPRGPSEAHQEWQVVEAKDPQVG